jgi:hypothetical protein
MSSVEEIVARYHAEGIEPDEETLRELVGRHVLDGVVTGYQMAQSQSAEEGDVTGERREVPQDPETMDGTPVKRQRTDEGES